MRDRWLFAEEAGRLDDDYPRKLIEVALPLREISRASVADKNRKVGTIKNLHKWFAPMPTPALRALIFATLVNDPGNKAEREQLTEVIKKLLPENGTAPSGEALEQARDLIARDNPVLPTVLDPFCGGGSTVVEAQRLGLPVVASDLNPVAVLITRVLGELLPPMAHAPSVSPTLDDGLLEQQSMLDAGHPPFKEFITDLRYYGSLVQQAVQEKLGDLYPDVPQGAPVAWLWCRTVPCPNPMCGVTVPLVSSPTLSSQPGREATVEPVVDGKNIRFIVHKGKTAPARMVKIKSGRARFECLACRETLSEGELREAGRIGTLGLQLMAVCVDAPDGLGRTILSPDQVAIPVRSPAVPPDLDEIEVGKNTRDFRTGLYGLKRHIDLYTPRQLAVLAGFADEVAGVADRVLKDGGDGRQATAIASLLGLCIGKLAQGNSTLVRWRIREGPSKPEPAFGTQAIPMLWDFAESYPFGKSVGSWQAQISSVIGALAAIPDTDQAARVVQGDARRAGDLVPAGAALLATDPPYFSQINYADLADYFYLWLRRAMRAVHPDLFATLATPKAGELTANPERFGGSKSKARQYFIAGFTEVFFSLKAASRPDLPLVVAYAHRQDEQVVDGITSTGWASLLEAMLAADLGIVRTWPIEATSTTRQVRQGANALASYVILICRPRPARLPVTDRKGFLDALDERLPSAIKKLEDIAAVDLAQAAIGPGMEVFSGFSQVIEKDGTRMPVATALALINDKLQGILWDHESDFDRETRVAVAWYDEFGWTTGESGRAEQIAFGKNTTIKRLVQTDIMWSRGGDTRLVMIGEFSATAYDLARDQRLTVWETALRLSDVLEKQGVPQAARFMAAAQAHVRIDAVRELAHLLYQIGERRKRSEDQRRFNTLITAWPDLVEATRTVSASLPPGQLPPNDAS